MRRWSAIVALLAVAGSDDAPVACGGGLDGDWPEAPSKAPPDWLRVPRQSPAWAVTMVLALPACRGEPAALPQACAVVLECSSTCLNCSAWLKRAV